MILNLRQKRFVLGFEFTRYLAAAATADTQRGAG